MKILIIFSSSELGGAERSLSRMAMASNSFEYQLATVKGNGPWCEWVRSCGYEPLVFGMSNYHGPIGAFRALVNLFRYLHFSPVDVVYVCGFRLSLWVRLLRFLFPTTKIIHGVRWNPNSDSYLDRVFRFVEKKTSFLLDGWITNSRAAKNTLIQCCGIPDQRIHVVYNGVGSMPEWFPSYGSKELEVLTVANLNPRKGHREFLRTVNAVIQRVPDVRFIFIGRDDMHGAVQQAISDARLDDFVRYEGFQSDVTPWFRRARLFVLPSLWGEGCPTSILEAFSFSLPVIAYSIDGVPELVDDGNDGYLLPVMDEALAERIIELLLDPLRAEEMGQSGRAKVAEYFVLDACVSEHEEIFEHIVNK